MRCQVGLLTPSGFSLGSESIIRLSMGSSPSDSTRAIRSSAGLSPGSVRTIDCSRLICSAFSTRTSCATSCLAPWYTASSMRDAEKVEPTRMPCASIGQREHLIARFRRAVPT